MKLLRLCLLGLCWPPSASGQADHTHPAPAAYDSAIARFLVQAREGSARYANLREAIVAGYRLVGPDFPGMGEHWVNPSLILQGRFDPAEPQVLTYARIDGDIRLVAVAYAVALAPGESPPSFPGGQAWHDHTGTIDEESALLHQTISGRESGDGLRLAMLHAWTGLENPAGHFASDNWALPYARQGLEPGAEASLAAARAISLAAGGADYHQQLFRTVGKPSAPEEAVAERLLAQARSRVVQWLQQRNDRSIQVSAEENRFLSSVWDDAWSRIVRSVRPEVAARIRSIRSMETPSPDPGP